MKAAAFDRVWVRTPINLSKYDKLSALAFILVVELRDSLSSEVQLRAVHPYRLLLDDQDEAANWAKVDRIAVEIGATVRERLDELFASFGA